MKEYLLLRDNTELGHYSLEELKTLGLKSYDLIWIENKSFSWKYPSEIAELASFAPPMELPSLNDPGYSGGRLVQMVDKDWAEEPDEAPVNRMQEPCSSFSDVHIVALKPKLEQLRIKTIKSPAHTHIVKVEVRDGESGTDLSAGPVAAGSGEETYDDRRWNNDAIAAAEQEPGAAVMNVFYQSGNNNRMEMIVLVIGAISLLAVLFLFLTASY